MFWYRDAEIRFCHQKELKQFGITWLQPFQVEPRKRILQESCEEYKLQS